MAERMSGTKTATPRSRQRFYQCLRQQFHQIDMRDWLVWPSPWLDSARELAIVAGREHRERFTCERSIHVPHLSAHDTALSAILAELTIASEMTVSVSSRECTEYNVHALVCIRGIHRP